MRKVFLLVVFLAATLATAQTYKVSGTLRDGSGRVLTNSGLQFTLMNCGQWVPQIPGYGALGKTVTTLPATAGVVDSTIVGTNNILCGGVASTFWMVQIVSNNVPVGVAKPYLITADWDYNTAPVCTTCGATSSVPIAPNPMYVLLNPSTNQVLSQPEGTSFEINELKAGTLCLGAECANVWPGDIAALLSIKVNIAALHPIAFSGAYTDLLYPPALSVVALSGKYDDLVDAPASPVSKTCSGTGRFSGYDASTGVFTCAAQDTTLPPWTTDCPTGYHVIGIDIGNQMLRCGIDVTPSLAIFVNGTQVASGVTSLNIVGSAGITLGNVSDAGSATVTITGVTTTQAQSPTFSPLPGTYASTQNVTLACASPAPTIYYTTDGTTPTHGSSTYAAPISAGNTTIKALCASGALTDSSVVVGAYTLQTPIAAVAPSSISFGTQKVSVASGSQTVTLSNTGTATMTISSISASGDYSETHTCTGTLAAGANCFINVVFTPTTTGTRTGTLSVADNASGSPHTVSLTGTGALPTASLSAASLTFVSQTVGTTSTGQAVTLTNGSAVALSVSSVSISGTNAGDYSQTNTCGTVAAGGTCTVTVKFKPTSTGTRTATVSISDDAAGSPQTISLTGTGALAPAPAVSLSPTSLTFTSQAVGTTSASRPVTLTNTGTASLTISTIGITGTNSTDFAKTTTCAGTLGAGSNCAISVTFSPTLAGTRTATLSIADNASGSPHSVSLTGTATGTPNAVLNPTNVNFGSICSGNSTTQNVTLTNPGSAVLNITSITVTGIGFSKNGATTCGASLNAGSSCTITVGYAARLSSATGSLSVVDNATGSPHLASLTGAGLNCPENP